MSWLFRKTKAKRQINGQFVILGMSGSGKTTLARYLETNLPVLESTQSTMGMTKRNRPVTIGDRKVGIIDVGGQYIYQQTLWQMGVQQSIAVIYLLDCNVTQDHPCFEEAKSAYKYMKGFVALGELPILLLINKIDLVDVNTRHEHMQKITALYELNELLVHPFTAIFPCSAKFGEGVSDAMQWLEVTLTTLLNRV